MSSGADLGANFDSASILDKLRTEPDFTASQSGATLYENSKARRITFSVVFLLLLPFYISLGPMLYARVSHGTPPGTLGLVLIAVCFSVIMFFIVTQLIFAIRSRVLFKEDAVKFTLPDGNRPTPMFKYSTHEIPYADVARVETYRELYGSALTPVVLQGARVMTKDGKRIPLGFVSEANVDPSLPFPEIAGQIADRANTEISDCGCTRRRFPERVLGFSSGTHSETPIENFNIKKASRSHAAAVTAVVLALGALVAFGIVQDLIAAGKF